MTASALVRPSTFSSSGSILISKWYSSPIIGDWILRIVPNPDGTGRLLANVADYDLDYDPDQTGEIYLMYQSLSSSQIELNQWSLVTMTFDAGSWSIYVDGRLVGQMITAFSQIEPDEYSTDDIYIGDFRGLNSLQYRFAGDIDDVRIYDRALSQSEIQALRKNHCQGGGWQAFGFRNQGQCVREVETGKDDRLVQ